MLLRRSCCSTCLILCLLVNSVYCTSSGSKTQLYVGGMFPLGTRFGNLNGSELASICNVAVEMVNNRSNILTNYNLNLIYNDTKVKQSASFKYFYHFMNILWPGLNGDLIRKRNDYFSGVVINKLKDKAVNYYQRRSKTLTLHSHIFTIFKRGISIFSLSWDHIFKRYSITMIFSFFSDSVMLH